MASKKQCNPGNFLYMHSNFEIRSEFEFCLASRSNFEKQHRTRRHSHFLYVHHLVPYSCNGAYVKVLHMSNTELINDDGVVNIIVRT